MAQAVEWWSFDWEYSYTPEQSSALWSVVNYNTTFYQYSADNNYVYDSRGFNSKLLCSFKDCIGVTEGATHSRHSSRPTKTAPYRQNETEF